MWVITAIAVAGAGVSAYGQVQAGKAQEEQMKQQAEQERIAAESRELQRREELNRALASNIAAQSISGIAGEGTPESLAIESAKKAGLSEATIDLSERLRQSALIRAGKTAKQTAYIGAAGTLLSGTATALNASGKFED